MSNTTKTDSNFNVSFAIDGAGAILGKITLEADPDFNSKIPGAVERFYLFKKFVKDIKLYSTLGNISYLGTKDLLMDEIIAITSDGSLGTAHDITTLNNISLIGKSFNYSGIIQDVNGEYIVKKTDETLNYVMANVSINYVATADYYELTHDIPQLYKDKYEIGILAMGVSTL